MPDDSAYAPFAIARRDDGTRVELGRGAMGITYQATDTQLGRTVALKVINATFLGDPIARQRFLAEARAAAQLHHSNVAGVFQLCADGEDIFYAMEFVEGETVEAYVKRRGPLPARLALRVILQAAQGLAAANERGLIHRDIKPANLMLARAPAPAGEEFEHEEEDGLLVKVIDFGLAKSVAANESAGGLTGGSVVGTPYYMSPEQISIERGGMLDCRSDIYSLGVTLWYLLMGRAPFEGSQFQILSQHLQKRPPLEQLSEGGVPADVIALIASMLAKDRDERPANHSALIAALKKLLRSGGGTTSTAGPRPATESTSDATIVMPGRSIPAPTTRAPRRNPAWALVAIAVAAALILGGWLLRRGASTPAATAVPELSEAATLAKRAQDILERLTYTREDLGIAEELSRRATELDPSLPFAWSVRSRIQAAYLLRWWDTGEKRRQDTEAFAKRTLALDPNDTGALYALSRLLLLQGAPKQAEELLRRALALRPDDNQVRRGLANALADQQRRSEQMAELQEVLRRDPQNALAHYDMSLALLFSEPSDLAGAFREVNAALAIQPFTGARLQKIRLLAVNGDIAAMRTELDQIPSVDQGEERVVYIAMWVALLEGNWAKVLEASALTAKNYFDDQIVAGPKGWLTALAYSIAGKESLARGEWQKVESILRQRVRDRPTDLSEQGRLAVTLAWLGRNEEAAREIAPVEAAATEGGDDRLIRLVAQFYAAQGNAAKAVPGIRRTIRTRSLISGALLSRDPFWMKLRGQPEFEALVREMTPTAAPIEPRAPAVDTNRNSVAVLPFVNMSADKNDEYLSDGMTEELLSVLAKVKGLRVPGRTSSFAFKGRNEDGIFRKVGEELQVKTVLEGSVRKAGDKLRITAQLINVADGYHLWSETYDADMKDILAVQSDVAQRVVRALQVQLGVDEEKVLAKTPTQNPEAYRLYLLGRYHFAKFTREGWANAIRSFEQALKIDPGFVLAYCGLADTYGWCGGQIMPGREAWAKEKELALKALALDPKLAEAHLSLAPALFSKRDYASSVQSLERALALDPGLALAYDQYGWTLLGLGRPDESVAKERKAVELDPLNPLLNTDLGLFLQMARRYDEAIVELRKTLELDNSNALAHAQLAWSLFWKSQKTEALAEFKKATTLDDLPWYLGSLGYAYAATGDRGKAEQILRDLDELAKTRYVSPAARAAIYLGLGEKNKALEKLEKALEDEDPILWWYKSDKLYDSVRNEPRFQAIAKKADGRSP